MLFFRQQQQQQQQQEQKKALVLPLLFFLLTLCVIDNGVVIVHAEEVNLVVFLPPTAHSSAEGSYFPLAPALESVVRLAAEDLNEDDSLLNGDEVTLSVVTSQQATEAASGLCSAIETNKTFAVSEIHVYMYDDNNEMDATTSFYQAPGTRYIFCCVVVLCFCQLFRRLGTLCRYVYCCALFTLLTCRTSALQHEYVISTYQEPVYFSVPRAMISNEYL